MIDVQEKSDQAARDIKSSKGEIDGQARSFLLDVNEKRDQLAEAINRATKMTAQLEDVEGRLGIAMEKQTELDLKLRQRNEDIQSLERRVGNRLKEDSMLQGSIAQIVATVHRETLRGERGDDGQDGKDGRDGNRGDAGRDGSDGRNGEDGTSVTAEAVADYLLTNRREELARLVALPAVAEP